MTSSVIAAVNRRARGCLLAVVVAASVAGCNKEQQHPSGPAEEPQWSKLDAVAKVGNSLISPVTLERAQSALAHSKRNPLSALVDTRLYAQFAEDGGLDPARARMVSRAVLGRAWMERLEAEARKAGPPTDAELAAFTERRWIECDRPEALQTCHALVHSDNIDTATGQAAAQKLADLLKPNSRCDDFLERAKAFSAAGVKVTAERLPPVLADGRTLVLKEDGSPVGEGPGFDIDFARATHQLRTVGEQSEVIRSAFGWHIILLESRVPAKRLSVEERRQTFAGEILLERAKNAVDRSIARVQERTPVTIDRAAIAATGRIRDLQ